MINHRGWTTTEENLKSSPTSIVLAKTTLEKLAAFRYTPASDHQTANNSHPALENMTGEPRIVMLPHEPLHQEEYYHVSDYDLLSSSDDFSAEAPWGLQANTKHAESDVFAGSGWNPIHDVSTRSLGVPQRELEIVFNRLRKRQSRKLEFYPMEVLRRQKTCHKVRSQPWSLTIMLMTTTSPILVNA